jgi:hypothetical protein
MAVGDPTSIDWNSLNRICLHFGQLLDAYDELANSLPNDSPGLAVLTQLNRVFDFEIHSLDVLRKMPWDAPWYGPDFPPGGEIHSVEK